MLNKITLALSMVLLFCVQSKAQSPGNSLHFDGVNDYVLSPMPQSLYGLVQSDFTVEFWAKPEQKSGPSRPFFVQESSNNYASAVINSLAIPYLFIRKNGIQYSLNTTQSIPFGQWSHVAFTFDASTNTIAGFINGVQVSGISGGSSSNGIDGYIAIGGRTDGTQTYAGELDEFKLWNGIRTACDIHGSMNTEYSVPQQDLMLYYNFNQGIAGGNNTQMGQLTNIFGVPNGNLYNFSLNNSTSNFVSSGAPIILLNHNSNQVYSIDEVTSCDSYTWIDGNTYSSNNNTATYSYTTAAGCSITEDLDLTIIQSSTRTDVVVACDTYTWIDGNTYSSSNNTATHTLTNAVGCDSVITLDLTINQSTTHTDVVVACNSYTWIDGNTYSTSNNTATHTLSNAAGCDSVVTLDLTINQPNTGTDTVLACDSYTWIDGNTYSSSNNTATHTLTNAAGCDSVVTLNLTITNSTAYTDVQSACDSYTWIDGNTYSASNNTATHTLTNAVGCDSVVTLDLTITNSTTYTDVQSACDSYTWIDGNTYSSSNNTATHTLTNAVGCDSVVTLDLTITNSTAYTDVQSACDSFTWIDGNTYSTSNNTATHTLTNAAGCDSVVTLDLTITNSTAYTDVQSACDSYTWIDGNTYSSSNNTATHTLTNAAGCDSVVTLDLTITNSTAYTDVQSACDSYTWIDGNTYSTSNNTATHTLTNAVGCDSVVTLDLTINSIEVSVSSTAPNTLEADATEEVAMYQWFDCVENSVLTGETEETFTAQNSGEYAVFVQGANGCVDTSNCVSIIGVGVDELTQQPIEIYPNPTQGEFTVDLGLVMNQVSVVITTLNGQQVYNQNFGTTDKAIIAFSGASGVYLCRVNAENGYYRTLKLVKQ